MSGLRLSRCLLVGGLLAGCLLVGGLLAGCSADDAALEARLCADDTDCPPGRACVERACVLPDAERTYRLCQGSELRTVRVTCDDYTCAAPTVVVLDRVDCAQPLDDTCDGALLMRQRPGVCDPTLQRCEYPVAEPFDCSDVAVSCDGDMRLVRGGGCDAAARACTDLVEPEDCRATIGAAAARCDGRFLERPSLPADVSACDPATRACRQPEIERVDCTADRIACEGNRAVVQRNGVCQGGEGEETRCVYAEGTAVDCAEPPPGQCDGDLRLSRGRGGICDPLAGTCRYPDPTVEDCGRERAECHSEVSSVRPAGACEDGRCTAQPEVTDCTAARGTECMPGPPFARRIRPGGVCDRGSGRCAYPDPIVEPCPSRAVCVQGASQSFFPVGCADGICQEDEATTPCMPPIGRCIDGVAHNYDGPARCDERSGRCAGPGEPSDRQVPCADELFCQENVLFGPGDPNCRVEPDGIARCQALPLLDCNRAPAPTCDGSQRVAHVGPGVCDAVAGCRFGEARVTDCAACLPAGAICVLPGTVRLAEAAVALETAPRLVARYDGALVMTTTELSRGEVERLIGRGFLRPLLGPAPAGCGPSCPATGLSWVDAVAIANARSVEDGLAPCYDAAGRVIGGADGDPYLCVGWRLPTEVEWVAAWRADTETRWPCGDDAACLVDIGAQLDAAGPRSVGAAPANPRGLYDLGGNAREWMHDAFAPLTGGREPHGPLDGTVKVLRGGSWLTGTPAAAASARFGVDGFTGVEDAGVRLVRGLAPRPPARCEIDPVTEQAAARVFNGRGSCALTPGVPCAFDEVQVRCAAGCRAGICLGVEDLSVDGGLGGDGEPDEPEATLPFEFAAIPAGTFTHGTGAAARRTTISHDFWLMTGELTYLHFQRLLAEGAQDPAGFARLILRNLILEDFALCRENPLACLRLPAFGLSWLDAIRMANALSHAEQLPPCYDDDGRVDGGVDGDPQSCLGYRLPTEAEWVYAARAGTSTTWPCGDDPQCLGQAAVYAPNAGIRIDRPEDCPCQGADCPLHAVTQAGRVCRFPASTDSTPANGWGLIGMAGNVAEWVADHGDGSGPPVGGLDPYRGPADGLRPVLKGGAWFEQSDALRVDARALPAGELFPGIGAGARLARTIPAVEIPTVRIDGPRTAGAVTVTRDFEVTAHEISRAAATALGARDAAAFRTCGDDCGINRITRQQAVDVANALSRRHGHPPCYTADGHVRASADDDPYRCEGWRLPTEAEWRVMAAPCDAECLAAQAWTLCTSGFDDDDLGARGDGCSCEPALYEVAIETCGFPADALPHPACDNGSPACFGPRPVATRDPDGAGLYDRAGNLREWLHDRWSPEPPTGRDPYGAADTGPILCDDAVRNCFTVIGGSWADPPAMFDVRRPQHEGDLYTGFRLVRTVPFDAPGEAP